MTPEEIAKAIAQSDQTAKCRRCSSKNRPEFSAELAIHFTGLPGLDKPPVWVFPKLFVCLNCGLTEFIVPRKELQVLETGAPVKSRPT